jgi:hypothetical protein
MEKSFIDASVENVVVYRRYWRLVMKSNRWNEFGMTVNLEIVKVEALQPGKVDLQ